MLVNDLKALEKDALQACMFSLSQSLAHLVIHVCVMTAMSCECVYVREIETVLMGLCVIVLSSEACREKGHVLSSDHIVY